MGIHEIGCTSHPRGHARAVKRPAAEVGRGEWMRGGWRRSADILALYRNATRMVEAGSALFFG